MLAAAISPLTARELQPQHHLQQVWDINAGRFPCQPHSNLLYARRTEDAGSGELRLC